MATLTCADQIVRLSSIDQSMPRVYIRLALVYKRTDTNLLAIAHRLEPAVKATITRFPILAGVVRPATDEQNTQQGRLEIATSIDRVKAFKPRIKSVIGLEGIKTYEALEAAGMPALHLISEYMAPLIDTPDGTTENPAFAMQANLLDGGLVVAVYLHHAVGDMTTLRMIIADLSSDVAPPSDLTADGLTENVLHQSAQRDRLAGPMGQKSIFAEGARMMHITVTATRQLMTQINTNAPGNTCCLFSFDLALLENVKAFIAGRNTHDRPPAPVTSFAILTAILWKAITRARMLRGILDIDENDARRQTSSMATPVNFRNKIESLGDEDYFGNAILTVFANQPIQKLAMPIDSTGLENAARAVMTATSSIFEGKVRSTIAAINEATDVSDVKMKQMRLASDLAIWSWADLDLKKATLGLGLGEPGWARQMSSSVDTFVGCIVHTKREEARLWDVMVQLPLETMQRLREDTGFMRFVKHYA